MLYALGDPLSLLLLLAGFVLAVTVHGWVQAVVASRTGDQRPRMEGRTSLDPRRHLDPFGAVAAGIAGVGWAKPFDPPDRRRSKGSLVAVLLSGAVVNLVLGFALLGAFRAAGGRALGADSAVLQSGVGGDLLLRALLLLGLASVFTGLLSLVPLPPMDGGRLLFALAPRTPGWQKAEYQLDERNIGIAVLLALLLPLLATTAPVLFVLDTVIGPLVDLVTGV